MDFDKISEEQTRLRTPGGAAAAFLNVGFCDANVNAARFNI